MKKFLFFILIFCVFVPKKGDINFLNANDFNILADKIEYKNNGSKIIAKGDVKIKYNSYFLKTNEILFDKKINSFKSESPLKLITPDKIIILSKSTEMKSDFKTFKAFKTRTLIDKKLQIASEKIEKKNNDEIIFYKTVGSTCTICKDSLTPIWQIKSEKIIHSQKNKNLTFKNAWLEVIGFPILYTPFLKTPQPGVKRATGLLTPKIITSNLLGFGLKQPYYFNLNSSSDATFSILKTSKTNILFDAEYRKFFENGNSRFFSAFVPNNSQPKIDGFFKAEGNINLKNNYNVKFDVTSVSNSGFLGKYDYSNVDRIKNLISLEKISSNSFSEASLIYFTSLRDNALIEPAVLPSLFNRSIKKIDFLQTYLGKEFSLSSLVNTKLNDSTRLTASIDTTNIITHPLGFKIKGLSKVVSNVYFIKKNNDIFTQYRIDPIGSIQIEFPLIKKNKISTEFIKPKIQLIYNPVQKNIMNIQDDSQQIQIDKTSLFSLNRFTGYDKQETGLRLNAGIEYEILNLGPFSYSFALGQIFREKNSSQFSTASGLSGIRSDILVSADLNYKKNIKINSQQLYGENLNLKKAHSSVEYLKKETKFSAGLTNYIADPIEGRYQDINELTLIAEKKIYNYLTSNIDLRRNLKQNKNINASIGFKYENECVKIDLSFMRRFTESNTLPEDTRIELNFDFLGFNKRINKSFKTVCYKLK